MNQFLLHVLDTMGLYECYQLLDPMQVSLNCALLLYFFIFDFLSFLMTFQIYQNYDKRSLNGKSLELWNSGSGIISKVGFQCIISSEKIIKQ